jgi:hypothetical protein
MFSTSRGIGRRTARHRQPPSTNNRPAGSKLVRRFQADTFEDCPIHDMLRVSYTGDLGALN